jgi:hypothetical protein
MGVPQMGGRLRNLVQAKGELGADLVLVSRGMGRIDAERHEPDMPLLYCFYRDF